MSCRRRSRRKKVPEDYVDEAERIMRSLMSQPKKVTTSKIRNLLSLVTDIYNEEKHPHRGEAATRKCGQAQPDACAGGLRVWT